MPHLVVTGFPLNYEAVSFAHFGRANVTLPCNYSSHSQSLAQLLPPFLSMLKRVYITSHPQVQIKYNPKAKQHLKTRLANILPPSPNPEQRNTTRALEPPRAYTYIPDLIFAEKRISFFFGPLQSAFGSLSLRRNSYSLNQNLQFRGKKQFKFTSSPR